VVRAGLPWWGQSPGGSEGQIVLGEVLRYWRTGRYLRGRQLAGFLRERLCQPVIKGAALPVRLRTGDWVEGHWRPASMLPGGRVWLLNREETVGAWNSPARPRLWDYHLHYFEDPRVSADWVERWIGENPVGVGSGWEPYPLSRRVVNWIRWRGRSGEQVDGFDASLSLQARALFSKVEYRLLANHLFANAKALVYAGTYFEGPEAARWLDLGLSLLAAEVREQVLKDGGHFERSPMYHALILEDLLDLESLRLAYPGVFAERAEWTSTIRRMLAWLGLMSHPDGEIGFFQDACFGVAASYRELVSYAGRLGIGADRPGGLSDSGYRRLELGELVVLFDGGGPSPDYQPGHAHAGTLSVEASWRGGRVIVNSGTSSYAEGAVRGFERSTAAHATVRVDGRDSSEMWGAFRVGRRARVRELTDGVSPGVVWSSAWHTGYAPVRHARRVSVADAEFVIDDELSGGELLEWFFPLHPSIEARGLELWRAGWRIGVITPPLGVEAVVEPAEWRPEFHLRVPGSRVRMVGRGAGKYVTRVRFE
jgi:hypothetical protein